MPDTEFTDTLNLKAPYRSRFAAEDLRDRIISFLKEEKPKSGTPFLTDADLVARTGLSRSTVRRALDNLQREGWIERRIGQGTFVGPRAGAFSGAKPGAAPAGTRLAVLIYSLGDLAHDWYTPLILQGIDNAAGELGLGIELLGTRDRNVDAISQRIEQTLPDVLACLSNDPREAFVIRDAQRLGIPCIVSGTPHMRLGLPCVCEDNVQAMQLAVRRLTDAGHTNIALSIQRNNEPWVFDRHTAFFETLARAGIMPDGMPVHWFPAGTDRALPEHGADDLLRFIEKQKPTAMIAGSRLPMLALDALVASGAISIPDQLSIVSFEQETNNGRPWFNGITPDTVELPLNQIGKKIAELASRLATKHTIPTSTVLPANILPGQSVKRLK